MFPSIEPINDFTTLEHAIHHDIVDIEDTDEFLTADEIEIASMPYSVPLASMNLYASERS